MCSEQPGALQQYESWKKFPKTYRKPTDEEWISEIDRLTKELAQKEIEIAAINKTADDAMAGWKAERERADALQMYHNATHGYESARETIIK